MLLSLSSHTAAIHPSFYTLKKANTNQLIIEWLSFAPLHYDRLFYIPLHVSKQVLHFLHGHLSAGIKTPRKK